MKRALIAVIAGAFMLVLGGPAITGAVAGVLDFAGNTGAANTVSRFFAPLSVAMAIMTVVVLR